MNAEQAAQIAQATQTTQILKAGGVVPLKAKLAKDDAVDTVVARAYRHPILGGRVVIRLTAENVTQGDDLEMSTLGFGAGEDRGAVGKERRRALGFPGWPLVHDPKNARFALDVVDELKKQVRKAKSKPGHAKDGVDAIAAKLAKSVPHFLPSFYEEAGRGFIEHGAIAQAAICFGKAREAEAVHALAIDETARVDSFLEFALAGAVTTKALAQYAKDLTASHEPRVAYQHFRQLCLQRTLGGMPPWAGMATELRRLAKAAKLDSKQEDAQFVSEIVESPALAKAAGDFWRTYEEPLAALGKSSAKVRGILLNLFPTGSTYKPDLDEAWLDLLEATGAMAALEKPDADVAVEARTQAGRAAWFDKLTHHLTRDYRSKPIPARAFAILKRIAPRLVEDGKPIKAAGRWGRQIDLDLAELALALGVALKLPEYGQFHLPTWAAHVGEPDRGVDPVRVAAHPELGRLLAKTVGDVIGGEPFDSASRGKAGFLAAKRAFVEDLLAKAERGGLPAFDEATAKLVQKVNADTFAELPDLFARVKALDVAPALARTLRIGLVDELGYPALEDVEREIDPDGSVPWVASGGLQALVLSTKTKSIAVGPHGRLGEHDLVIPPKHEFLTVRFIGGEFLVFVKEGYSTVKAYWSSAPQDLFLAEGVSSYSVPGLVGRTAVTAEGAWLESDATIRRGERNVKLGAISAFDGATRWTSEWKDGRVLWFEISASGEKGRASWPAFIEHGLESGWTIEPAASYVLPAPAGTSPLGVRDGMIGMRIHDRAASGDTPWRRRLTRIDGEALESAHGITALVRFPDGTLRPLIETTAWRDGVTTTITDGELRGSLISNAERRYARGQAVPLPPLFWHLFQARDEAGSRKLRAITDDDARTLIAAIPVQQSEPVGVVHPIPDDAIATALPEVTHPRLRRGVEGVTTLAVELGLRRDKLVAERAPGAARPGAAAGPTGPTDEVLAAVLEPWTGRIWGYQGSAWTMIEQVVREFAAEDRSDRKVPSNVTTRLDWMRFALCPAALGFIGTALGTRSAQRAAAAELLELLAALPPPERLRLYHVSDALEGETVERAAFEIRWRGGNAYAIRKSSYAGNHSWILEYAPDGQFRSLGATEHHVTVGTPRPSADALAALAAAMRGTQTSWSPAAAQRLAAGTGLTPSEATFLWAGCPKANDTSANFLDKELREQLGLKAAQAALARDSITLLGVPKKLAIIDDTARAGAAALLDGSAVEACIAAFVKHVGKRVAVPEQVLADADDEISGTLKPALALAIYASGGDDPRLERDGIFALGSDGSIIRVAQPEPLVGQSKLDSPDPAFDLTTVTMHCAYAPFLFASLPVGDPLRAKVPQVHARVLDRLANPHLWVDAGARYDSAPEMAALYEALGGEVLAGGNEHVTLRKVGPAVIARSSWRTDLRLAVAQLDRQRDLVDKLVALVARSGSTALDALDYVRGPELAAMVARIEHTPVPAGRWEQDPRASAPEVVAAVARHCKLSSDAAALYLQYLVLLWPTAKNLCTWNGYKPKQLEPLVAELVKQDLVLEAKRERAGRAYFLPGGWEANKSPKPPLETWKLPLYTVERTLAGTPTRRPLFDRYAAHAPFHVLFERAWARIQSGDVPRYEEVKRS